MLNLLNIPLALGACRIDERDDRCREQPMQISRPLTNLWSVYAPAVFTFLMLFQGRSDDLWGQATSEPTLPPIVVKPPAVEAPVPIVPPPVPAASENPFDDDQPAVAGDSILPDADPSFTGLGLPNLSSGPTGPSGGTRATTSSDPSSARMNGSANDSDFDLWPSLSEERLGDASTDLAGLNSILRSEGTLFDVPQLATIVDRDDINERMSSNMFRALQTELGVTLQQTGNGQLSPFLRGLTGQQILVLVDGIRLNTSILRAGPNQYAATVDPGMIDRIEIVRGAQSVLWGSDAIGGAINIVTRGASPLARDYTRRSFQQLVGTADSSSYSRANLEGWVDDRGLFAGGSYLNTNDLDIGGGRGRQPATGYDQYAGDLKYDQLLTDDMLLTVAMQHFEQNHLARSDRFLPFTLGPAPDGSVPVQRPTFFDPQQRDLVYLRLQGMAPVDNLIYDAWSGTISYSRVKEGSTIDRYNNNTPTAQLTRRDIGEFEDDMFGANLAFVKQVGDWVGLTYGGDFYYEDIDASRTRINNPNAPGASGVPIDPQYPDDAIANRVGIFAQGDVQLTDRLSAQTGVRYENLDQSATPNFIGVGPVSFDRSFQDWIASVGLTYEMASNLHLVGGVYEGFRAPTLDDLTANTVALQNVDATPRLGDLNIQSEHTLTYEVGMKGDFDRWRTQVFQWWTDFESVIGRQIIQGNQFLANRQAMLSGTDASAEFLLDPSWSLYGNFSYVYGDLWDDRSEREPFSRIPPTQGILGLRWKETSRRAYFDIYTWLVRRQDRYNSANLSDVRFIPGGTPGYGTLNLRMGKALDEALHHQVSLSIENITDKYYRVLGSGVDGAGIHALFGYQLSF